MSARNSLHAKAERRRRREIRHVGGCAICGSDDVAWCNEKDAADPSYRAICLVHLCYAVSTLFVGENPGLTREREERPDERRERVGRYREPKKPYDEPRHGNLAAMVDTAVRRAKAAEEAAWSPT